MAVGDITALLDRVRGGEAGARDALLPLVYGELEAIARAYVRDPRASLEPRGLVHELYLKLAESQVDARDRKHFYAIAACAMRQILTDRARRRGAAKRGANPERVTLSGLGAERGERERNLDILAVDAALTKLEQLSARQARVVELRCLLGLSMPEIAEALEVSERTAHGDWRLARAWLLVELSKA